MKQEHRTTPPADDATSPPRVCPHSCDATAEKPTEEIGRETPAHEVRTANGTEKSGERALADRSPSQSATRLPTSAKRATAEKLRKRYLDSQSHSFPTYGNPRSGVPVSDPMSHSLRDLLKGDFKPKNDIGSRGLDSSSKRPAQSQKTHAEPTRSSKRQKTEARTESPSDPGFSTARFVIALPSATSSERSPLLKDSPFVDLTGSQKSRDGDIASNRSEYEPVLGASEFRQMEKTTKNGSTTTNKRPRNRKLLCKQATPAQYESPSEDELGRAEERPRKKRNGATPKVPVFKRFQPAKYTSIPSENVSDGISDGDLQQVAELAKSKSTPAPKAKSRRIEKDPISDDDETTSPYAPGRRVARADILPVDFSKKRGKCSSPVFRLKRAVAAPSHVRIADIDAAHEPILRVENSHTLIAVNSGDQRRDDYHWLEVKLNFCTEIMYTTSGPAIALLKRANKRCPLVLEFAKSCDALTFGLWAQKTVEDMRTLSVKIDAADSDRLQRVLDRQWELAVNHKPRPGTQPDDIKYLEHEEEKSVAKYERTPSRIGARPNSSQKNTPYQSSTSLRSGMTSADSASARDLLAKKTLSPYFSRDNDTSGQAEPRRSTRQTKDIYLSRVSDAEPRKASPRSLLPVPWTAQNPDWGNIWDDKPLIFPASGKNRTTIYRDDINRLEEGEFMNDNLIGFYSRYLQIKLEVENKEAADRIYFMNTYFYPKLTEKKGRGINYAGVRTWTAKVDLFSYDYIIVPVNEQAHWYLAIICHPSKLIKSDEVKEDQVDSTLFPGSPKEGLVSTVGEQVEHMSLHDADAAHDTPKRQTRESSTLPAKSHAFVKKTSGSLPRKKDPSEARVVTLDSLGTGHSATCGNLKDYLVHEALDKKRLEIEPPAQFGMTAKNIPEQVDHASCGAFLLGYLREFLKNPDDVVRQIVRKEDLDWEITSLEMRGELRSIIIEQRKEQNERNAKLAAEKRVKKRSNSQAPASSRSPEKELSGPPATPTPRTPTAVGDVPKKPSSTIKGSPSVILKDRSSSPAKKATDDNVTVVGDQETHKSTAFAGLMDRSNDANQAFVRKFPERPRSPARSQPSHRAMSSPCQVRSSPRHNNKGRITSSADKSRAASLAPVFSPEAKPISKSEQASDGSKRGLNPAEQLLNQLSSPSKSMPIRAEMRASAQHGRSDSPSQQLLSELRASPSKSTRVERGRSESGTETQPHQSTVEDYELSSKSSLRTRPTGPVHTSHHFLAQIPSSTEPSLAKSPPVKSPSVRSPPDRGTPVKSSPSLATRRRQPSLEEIPRLSVENAETYDKSPGSKHRKARHPVTVDLTN